MDSEKELKAFLVKELKIQDQLKNWVREKYPNAFEVEPEQIEAHWDETIWFKILERAKKDLVTPDNQELWEDEECVKNFYLVIVDCTPVTWDEKRRNEYRIRKYQAFKERRAKRLMMEGII